jgi:hypothetical protein
MLLGIASADTKADQLLDVAIWGLRFVSVYCVPSAVG